MDIKYLKKRIIENKLKHYAAANFVDETSPVIQSLEKNGKNPLLGIQRKDGTYTILGENFVYYHSPSGNKGELTLNSFSDLIQDYGLRKGKIFTSFKFIKINDNDRIWLKNKSTMSALWNTVIWLERERKLTSPPDGASMP